MIFSIFSIKIVSWYDWMFAKDTCVDDIGYPLRNDDETQIQMVKLKKQMGQALYNRHKASNNATAQSVNLCPLQHDSEAVHGATSEEKAN